MSRLITWSIRKCKKLQPSPKIKPTTMTINSASTCPRTTRSLIPTLSPNPILNTNINIKLPHHHSPLPQTSASTNSSSRPRPKPKLNNSSTSIWTCRCMGTMATAITTTTTTSSSTWTNLPITLTSGTLHIIIYTRRITWILRSIERGESKKEDDIHFYFWLYIS